ncbi:hypothetical protein [Bradyrhizobium australafricanum]|uniref:hypothetical protein n=1 Tax=Bradyrhizobium australafricanum TaxID=2821406 RepID=UPI001CE2C59F|nr:hypothetical protein [Bradyrhizobium australafricanum]MCA6098877.1 hypothetical protein [Bradyrhizobium australafricanum]
MKISVVETLRPKMEARVNQFYMVDGHDIAHDRKRTLAQLVANGAKPTAEFKAAADIEGVTPQALAATILNKPDDLMTKENARRAMVLRVRAAKTPDDLKAIEAEMDAARTLPVTSRFI